MRFQSGAADDGTAMETRILKNGYVRVYRLGRTFLLDGLLQKFRAGQIRHLHVFAQAPRLWSNVARRRKQSAGRQRCILGPAKMYLAEFLRLYEHYRARASYDARKAGAPGTFQLTPNSKWSVKYFEQDHRKPRRGLRWRERRTRGPQLIGRR
jgi:hypothetical protein